MNEGKSKGGLETLAPMFIATLITAILLFSVILPVTNTNLASNATAGGNLWNQTGYTGAMQVANQIPLMFVLIFFVAIAVIVISQIKF